jgi:hypothetical protein
MSSYQAHTSSGYKEKGEYTMKLINLINARRVIQKYATEKISMALAYKMMKIMRNTDSDEEFYSTRFREIINSYGQKDEDGKLVLSGEAISLIPDTASDCQKAIKELEDTEVEMSLKLPLAELSELKMSMTDLFALENLIQEE